MSGSDNEGGSVNTWRRYRRTGISEMRPFVVGEDLAKISVSAPDLRFIAECEAAGKDPGGLVARNPDNHADQWYVAQEYADKNLALVED